MPNPFLDLHNLFSDLRKVVRKNKTAIFISLMAGVGFFFLAYSFMPKIYPNEELIKAVSGTFLQAVITAVITFILLAGQSNAEEVKETNVKVFEEKTKRYNEFIEMLWKAWANRKISLEELNDLFEYVSKVIVLFTKESAIQKILESLNVIAAHVGKGETTDEEKSIIQTQVFAIINVLAAEINLGGKITPEIMKNLNALEGKLLQFTGAKKYKEQFLTDFNDFITDFTRNQSKKWPCDTARYDKIKGYEYIGEYICMDINDTPIRLIVGPIVKMNSRDTFLIGFFVDWNHREYGAYRDASKCFIKNFLIYPVRDPKEMVDLGEESIIKLIEISKNTDKDNNPASHLAERVVRFYNEWKFNDKTIEQIIKECGSNKNLGAAPSSQN